MNNTTTPDAPSAFSGLRSFPSTSAIRMVPSDDDSAVRVDVAPGCRPAAFGFPSGSPEQDATKAIASITTGINRRFFIQIGPEQDSTYTPNAWRHRILPQAAPAPAGRAGHSITHDHRHWCGASFVE